MVTVLVGENDVARQQELTQIVHAFESEHGDMAVEKLDGEEASYQRILEAVQSVPFLASKKLVLLRSPSVCKEFVEQFEDFLGEIADTNDVVITEVKLDKRLAYYKALKKLQGFQEFALLDGYGVATYAVDVAKANGATLSSADARYLVERVGANQLAVQHEVEKLALYDEKITRQAIDLMTEPTPQSSVFDLIESAFAGDARRTTRLYEEQKALKVEPQQIVAMLAWQLHVLALVKTAGQRSPDDIAREAKVSPFVVRKSASLARSLAYVRLKELVTSLRELDERTKTDGTIADEALRYYLLKMTAQ